MGWTYCQGSTPPKPCPKSPSRGWPQRLGPQLSLVLKVLRTWAPQAFQKKTWTWSLHWDDGGQHAWLCPPPKGDHKGHDAKVSLQVRGTCNHRALRSKVRHPSPQSPCGCPAKLQEGSRSSPAASGDPQKEATGAVVELLLGWYPLKLFPSCWREHDKEGWPKPGMGAGELRGSCAEARRGEEGGTSSPGWPQAGRPGTPENPEGWVDAFLL